MKLITFILLFGISLIGYSQTLVWNEDFSSTTGWNLNSEPVGSVNAANANLWKIDDDEGGVTPPGCGVANNGNNTLYVGCFGATCIASGAAYFTGDGGFGFAPANTDRRASMTNPISTTGMSDLEVKFDWIGVGQAGADYAVFEYSINGGTTWTEIWTQTQGETCGSGQGKWKEESIGLPVAANNIADLRFAFRWRNDNDGAGTDPSFAVDNIRLFSDSEVDPVDPVPPVANFAMSNSTICVGDCINLTDLSTGGGITNWSWTFNGASVPSSTAQNPTNICYSTAGTYSVVLTVTNPNGVDTKTLQLIVNDCTGTPPTAVFLVESTTICAEECITFQDQSTGSPTSWYWEFEGGIPAYSNDKDPGVVCFKGSGNHAVTLTVTNGDGSNQISQTILALELPQIIATGDTLIDFDGSAQLFAEPIDDGVLFWEPPTGLSCTDCPDPIATPGITTDYYASLLGNNGCIGRDTVTVQVEFEDIISVPSAFSPNADGFNDVLYPVGPGIVEMEFRVYNRFGQLVFFTDEVGEGWDGTHNGQELNPGVFFYTIEYEIANGISGKKSGNVTLFK